MVTSKLENVPSDSEMLKGTLAIVLGGGLGERLYPLTRDRAKPAVPFGGIYRIIDFTLSNCLNSGLRRIYVLTQYKSISLTRHLRLGWDVFHEELGEFIAPIPPQQRSGERWYEGTADAIYQNIYTLERERPRWVLILAGDHIYKMNYLNMLRAHVASRAEVTVGCVEVPREETWRFGVVTLDTEGRIRSFHEKPGESEPIPNDPAHCLGSMGIYVFDTEVLVQAAVEDAKRDSRHDFGRDVLPAMLASHRVFGHAFVDENRKSRKYWRDIGTLDAYWQANMDLLAPEPEFSLYDPSWPIRTYQEQQPPAKMVLAKEPSGRRGMVLESLVSGGCVIRGGRVERCVLSPQVRVEEHAHVERSILMEGVVIGAYARVRNAIIDKGVMVAPHGEIGYSARHDRERFTVTGNGVVVVPKDVPSGEGFWR